VAAVTRCRTMPRGASRPATAAAMRREPSFRRLPDGVRHGDVDRREGRRDDRHRLGTAAVDESYALRTGFVRVAG
jgi:hypothetical protein